MRSWQHYRDTGKLHAKVYEVLVVGCSSLGTSLWGRRTRRFDRDTRTLMKLMLRYRGILK